MNDHNWGSKNATITVCRSHLWEKETLISEITYVVKVILDLQGIELTKMLLALSP